MATDETTRTLTTDTTQPDSEAFGLKTVSGDIIDAGADEHAPDFPEKLGKYQIQGILGQGAMGIVYKAVDPLIGRTVALKTVKTDLLDSQARGDVLARFRHEAQAAGRLPHPAIVTIFEYSVDQDTAFIAMEFIEGKELAALVKQQGQLQPDRIIRIFLALLDALGFVHKQGIVHRDIKPSNIILTTDEQIKLADFGIAHIDTSSLTQTGSVLGTPTYMSPEQCLGQEVDARSDLFSAGAVLYYLLTGKRPFFGDNPVNIMQAVINETPAAPSRVNPQLGHRFDAVVSKAMAKKPAERFQTADDFARALRALQTPAKRQKDKRHHLSLYIMAAGLISLAAGYLLYSQFAADQPDGRPQTVTAEQQAPKVHTVIAPQQPVKPVEIQPDRQDATGDKPDNSDLPFSIIPDKQSQLASATPAIPPPARLTITPNPSGKTAFNPGQTVTLHVSSDREAFVYCFYMDYAGQTMRVFPNRFNDNNHLAAGAAITIPGPDDGFEIVMEKPGSTETLSCIATRQALDSSSYSLAATDLEPLRLSLLQIQRELTQIAGSDYTLSSIDLQVKN